MTVDADPTTIGPRSFVLDRVSVVTVDANDTMLADGMGAIAVADGSIVGVGASSAVRAAHPGTPVIDGRGGIVLPGLVNAHAHLAMTLFRGVADDRDLQAFLARILPLEANVLNERTVRAGVRLAIAESLRAGCTAALDMYFWPEAERNEAETAGFRLETGPAFIGFDGPDRMPFPVRLAWADELLAAWPGNRWIMPHSTYTLTPDELAQVVALGRRHGARTHVHAAENQAEVDDVVARYGRRPVELLADLGALGPDVTLAHAVVLSDDEIATIAAAGAMVAHCPVSNLKTGAGFCRVPELLDAGVAVGLGTDGTATSNDLDPFLVMRTAAIGHKGHRRDASVLPAAAVLRMATMGSARATGLDHLVGSIEVGKRADLVLLDGDSLALTPTFDPVSSIVYAASRADVRDVWVDGRHVVDDRRLTTIDRDAVLAEMRALAAAMPTAP